jgi:hypothetical protein
MTRREIMKNATEEQRREIVELEQGAYRGRTQLLEIAREIPRALGERERRLARHRRWAWLTALITAAIGCLIYYLWIGGK